MSAFDFTALNAIAARSSQSNVKNLDKDSVMKATLQVLGELQLGASTTSPLATLASAGADQQLTVDATVGGVQLVAFDSAANYVSINVQDHPSRVTFDGSAPTSSNGQYLVKDYTELWSKSLAESAKFIRATGSSAIVHATPLK
jgi:hypothetical protein